MRPVTVTVVGAAGVVLSAPIVIDQKHGPCEVGFGFVYSGGTTTFEAQYSMDDPFGVYATDYGTNATWFPVTGMTAMVASQGNELKRPCRAVRLKANAGAGGTGVLTVVQSGPN